MYSVFKSTGRGGEIVDTMNTHYTYHVIHTCTHNKEGSVIYTFVEMENELRSLSNSTLVAILKRWKRNANGIKDELVARIMETMSPRVSSLEQLKAYVLKTTVVWLIV